MLGPAMLSAESVEASGVPNELACTIEAQRVYLTSTFRFAPMPVPGDSAPARPPAAVLVRRPMIRRPSDVAADEYADSS